MPSAAWVNEKDGEGCLRQKGSRGFRFVSLMLDILHTDVGGGRTCMIFPSDLQVSTETVSCYIG